VRRNFVSSGTGRMSKIVSMSLGTSVVTCNDAKRFG